MTADASRTGRRYLVLDVFTDDAFTGNPLAVVLDAENLDTAAMQRVAAEFNLSETVFVLPSERPAHRARLRIFTTRHELPFAGHPTVGAAVALGSPAPDAPQLFVLEETVGPVRCAVSLREGVPYAEFDCPRPPEALPFSADAAALAAALCLDPADIGFENHEPGAWSAGVPYATVPVAFLDALARARLDERAWVSLLARPGGEAWSNEGAPGAYLYCRPPVGGGFQARMLAAHLGLVEDPATGSAAAAFAGAAFRFDRPADGLSRFAIRQGVEMGRASRIEVEIEAEGGRLAGVRIGGSAVRVAEGRLFA